MCNFFIIDKCLRLVLAGKNSLNPLLDMTDKEDLEENQANS
jgi:hypothetical protein